MKLKYQVRLEFVLALGILAVSAFASYRSLAGLSNTLEILAKSYERLDKLTSLQSGVAVTESAARGYLLTNRNEYYQTYLTADRSVSESLLDLRHSMASEASEKSSFHELEGPIADRLALLRRVVALHRQHASLDQKQTELVTQSESAMARVNQAIEGIRRKEIGLLAKNRQEAEEGSHETILTLGAAFLAGFLLLISVFYLLTGEVQQRQEREEEIRRFSLALEQRNREVERATRLKSQFLASMSHELRTPLNAIIGFSDLLAEDSSGSISGKQKRHLEHIRTAGRHLLQLINDILDLTKIETGRMTLQVENLAPAEILPEVLSTISPLAMKKKITIESDMPGSLRLKADRVRLKQALYNLLSNAVKFTPEGGRVVIAAADQGEMIELSVADTGGGIRPEDQEAIFEEFHQVGETTKGVKEGTGLGLAITRRIVEQQGGKIRVESQLGQGANFIFTLPAAPAPAEPVREAEPAPQGHAGRPLVLVVDDEPVARELLVSFLAVDGYRTATASSVPEALERARNLHPDVVTVDVLMQGPTGGNVLAELKSQPETAGIPVVVVTVADSKDETLSSGAAEFLVKPARREDLLAAVGRQARAGAGGKPAILVVDDDPVVQHLLATQIRAAGYFPIVAGNGREGLDVLWHTRVEAIIVDLMLPEMDGFEVMRRIRQNPRLNNIPFFALTAKELSDSEAAILARETRSYFSKEGNWTASLLEQLGKILGQPVGVS